MLKTWLLAARPKTLFASICPVMIGTALAIRDDAFHGTAMLAALFGALAIQIGTNFCNDYFDFCQGADTNERLGPTRSVQAGLISPRQMLIATVVTFALVALLCIYLVARAGWPLAVIGVVSILCGVWYTASRFSLAYLGLGDLFVLVFFGPVAVAGTYYVQSLRLSSASIVAGLGPGFLSVAILVVNNLRDVAQDAQAQKRTLAVRFGSGFARWEYVVCLAGAAAVPPMLIAGYQFTPWVFSAVVGLLPGIGIARRLWVDTGRDLNPLLGKTGAVLLVYSITFSLSCVLA